MDNRQKLLDRALDLFSARGYDGVGIQEIVAAAKVTKPTLYHYFGSKRGLLEALLEEHLGRFMEQLAVAADYQHDLPFSLEKVARAFFGFAQASPTFFRLHLALSVAPPESEARQVVEPYLKREQRILEVLFELAERDHGNMQGRHARYARALHSLIDGYALSVLESGGQLDDKLAFDLVHQFSHGIYS
jgi:TetR/AcrR family transcriptional regulator